MLPSHSTSGAQCQRQEVGRGWDEKSTRPFAHRRAVHGSGWWRTHGKGYFSTRPARRWSGLNGTARPCAASQLWISSSSHAIAANPDGSAMPRGWKPRASAGAAATTWARSCKPVDGGSELVGRDVDAHRWLQRFEVRTARREVNRVPQQDFGDVPDSLGDRPAEMWTAMAQSRSTLAPSKRPTAALARRTSVASTGTDGATAGARGSGRSGGGRPPAPADRMQVRDAPRWSLIDT